MFYFFAPYLEKIWGPFRLFSSHLMLIAIGTVAAALITGFLLPAVWDDLPHDRGKDLGEQGIASRGKPTGAGLVMASVFVVIAILVVPPSRQIYGIIGCLLVAMWSGFADDRSPVPWGEGRKGGIDLLVALVGSLLLCRMGETTIWIPLFKEKIVLSVWQYVPLATIVLLVAINATNCSDGVDGLAGTLSLISLACLGAFLYIVVGHKELASYLLIPHRPEGASWAILIFTCVGVLCGYLWHNAYPSAVLMGDAGSRFLGLLIGVSVLALGNPFILLVIAPMILVNGGSGLGKLIILRVCRRCGIAIEKDAASLPIRLLHGVRFPLHDHVRSSEHMQKKWSNTQVLVRFALLHIGLLFVLLGLVIKLR